MQWGAEGREYTPSHLLPDSPEQVTQAGIPPSPCPRSLETSLRPGPLPDWMLGLPACGRDWGFSVVKGAQLLSGKREAEPGEPTGPDTPFPTLSPAVGAGCRPGGRAPFLKGPGSPPRPPPRPAVAVRVARPPSPAPGRGCVVGRGRSHRPAPHLPRPSAPDRPGEVPPPTPRRWARPPFRPLARPALPLASPRPALIGRLHRRSGHFLLGRGRGVKLWRRKKSHRLPATLPRPTSTAAGNAPFAAGPRPDLFPASETRAIPAAAPGPRDPSAHPGPVGSLGPTRSPTHSSRPPPPRFGEPLGPPLTGSSS